jgi:hypothetical protein
MTAHTPQVTELPIEAMRRSVHGLINMCALKHGRIDCPESVEEIVEFCRAIYRNGREHEREDNYGVANQN